MKVLRPLLAGALLLCGGPVFAATAALLIPVDACEGLHDASGETRAWIEKRLPNLRGTPIRIVTREKMEEWLSGAVDRGWGSVRFFSQELWRGDCRLYFPGGMLALMDSRYALDLVAPIAAVDHEGRRFQMAGLVSGGGEHHIYYDFAGRRSFRDPGTGSNYRVKDHVLFETPEEGRLNVKGVQYLDFLWNLKIQRIWMEDGKLKIDVGVKVVEREMTPIARRTPVAAPPPASNFVRLTPKLKGVIRRTLQSLGFEGGLTPSLYGRDGPGPSGAKVFRKASKEPNSLR